MEYVALTCLVWHAIKMGRYLHVIYLSGADHLPPTTWWDSWNLSHPQWMWLNPWRVDMGVMDMWFVLMINLMIMVWFPWSLLLVMIWPIHVLRKRRRRAWLAQRRLEE